MTQLFNYLVSTDERVQAMSAEPTEPAERLALVLGRQVTPEPFSARGKDWLVSEAMDKAKHIHLMPEVEMAIFTFPDRSVLVLFESGLLYAAPDASPANAARIEAWIESKGVGGKPQVMH